MIHRKDTQDWSDYVGIGKNQSEHVRLRTISANPLGNSGGERSLSVFFAPFQGGTCYTLGFISRQNSFVGLP